VGEQERLLQSIVREEWGAKDMMIVSDWWGVYSTTEAVLGGIDRQYLPASTVCCTLTDPFIS
jgi:hypothetical protein